MVKEVQVRTMTDTNYMQQHVCLQQQQQQSTANLHCKFNSIFKEKLYVVSVPDVLTEFHVQLEAVT